MTSFNERADEAVGILGRLIALTAVTALVVFLSGIALKPVFPDGIPPGLDGRILLALILGFALAVAHVVVVALLEQGHWRLTGFHKESWHPLGLGLGAAAGAVAVLSPGAALVWTGQLQSASTSPGEWLPFAVGTLAAVSALAAAEELIFRGYLFGLLLDRWGAAAALLLTSFVFAAVHAFNPGATIVSLAAVASAGLMLGAVRVRTGSTVAAWLAHTAINWVQAAVLRLPVSGLELAPPPGHRLESHGAPWLTGGAWGLEGGAAAAGAFLLISFLLLGARAPASSSARRR